MDHKEQISAANALVQWFNSQEMGVEDAKGVMSKLLAKLIVGSDRASPGDPPTRVTSALDLHDKIDLFTLQLMHDINERLYSVRRKR